MFVALAALAFALLAWWLWTPDRDRSLLTARYLAAPGDMLQVGGWQLHVRDSGPRDAPAVILIHGFGASLQTWDAWAQGLQRSHRVVRFDLPGSGLSLPDPAGDYTDARSMQILLALMDTLALPRASIVGPPSAGASPGPLRPRTPSASTAWCWSRPMALRARASTTARRPRCPASSG